MADRFGTVAANNLSGTTAADRLFGYTGNDTLSGLAGVDQLYGDFGNDNLNGGDDEDLLYGADGNDTLDGGIDDDTLIGGLGNDNYTVDSATDLMIEVALPAGGIDTVQSPVTLTLINGLENLTLLGVDMINGTGNTLRNVISGNDEANTLNGLGGNDTLSGGGGADTLIGLTGNDRLAGGADDDTLTGGTNAVQFVYDTNTAFAPEDIGIDRVTGFTPTVDKIVLDQTTFTMLTSNPGNGFSVPAEFQVFPTDAGTETAAALITYSAATGKLFYNENGADPGFGTGGQFATLTGNPLITANDFVIQA